MNPGARGRRGVLAVALRHIQVAAGATAKLGGHVAEQLAGLILPVRS
jgi:hypothetical protein